MPKRNSLFQFLLFIIPELLLAQSGSIKGKVFNSINNNPIPFANVIVLTSNQGSTTDNNGYFEIRNLIPGVYNLEVSYLGYTRKRIYELKVGTLGPTYIDIPMDEKSDTLAEIEITAGVFYKTAESPVSMRTIGMVEIERNPGGNRDISKVIQSLPGVATTVSFRNDIIIRGGAPGENKFYLDGIEVPNINHFATQGSSGGPVGMINVNFVREVDLYSGAFPANKGNALSSVFDIKQKDGNEKKIITALTLGSSDYGLTLDGPAGKKTTFVFSARRSYLGWLFRLLKLPFLPVYNDAQFKVKVKINEKNELGLIGLGAFDEFKLNKSADETELQQYILGNIPVNTQWNYAIGANWKHYNRKSYSNVVLSRNHLQNKAVKYFNNDESSLENLNLEYISQEIENKIRMENTILEHGFRINYGIGFENVLYTNSTYNKRSSATGISVVDFDSRLIFNKYAFFFQGSKSFFAEKIVVSAGIRSDFSDYAVRLLNPLTQLSPRISMAFNLTSRFSFNSSVGRYYQMPAYTLMGFRDSNSVLINKVNKLTYIACNHFAGGFEYQTLTNSRFTIESFFKVYQHYPFLTADSICMANQGGDYGIIGNEAATSSSSGRAYGFEFLAQQKLYKGFYGILAYTYVKSEFRDKNNNYVASTWDNRHIISLTAGKKFNRNWELGAKWRFQGGSPYTPIDQEKSSLKQVWNINGKGVLDYNQLNGKRLPPVHQLDLRIDKKLYFKRWSLNVYFDIQNVYGFTASNDPILLLVKDSSGNPVTDPDDPDKYSTKFIDNTNRTFFETLGIVVEF